MAESALVVNVPQAEPYVGAMRERFDPSARLGMPAHITLLYPFMSPEQITEPVLNKVRIALSSVVRFAFTLSRIDRFPSALYLAPTPNKPFIALTESLVRQFPKHMPYGGQYASIVPHLTVAQAGESDYEIVESQLKSTMPPEAGIRASCREVVLMENSTGRWKPMKTFPLAASPK